jgi:hypothetical protein
MKKFETVIFADRSIVDGSIDSTIDDSSIDRSSSVSINLVDRVGIVFIHHLLQPASSSAEVTA